MHLYKNILALFCKTCLRDKESLILQAQSIKKYNKDNLPYYISVTEKEQEDFEKIKKEFNFTYEILTDEELASFTDKSTKDLQIWDKLYIEQQVVKYCFYKTNLAKHYIVIDSDCYFIRNFFKENFLIDEDTPLLPICSGFKGDRQLIASFLGVWGGASEIYEPYTSVVGYKGPYITIEMPFVMTSNYMDDFCKNFIEHNGYTIRTFLEKYPHEMQHYCEYIITKRFSYQACNAFFLPLHFETQYQIMRWLGFDENIIAGSYLGILMNKGHVKSIKFKPNLIGKYFIRPLIYFNYKLTKSRNKPLLKFICLFIPSKRLRERIKGVKWNQC